MINQQNSWQLLFCWSTKKIVFSILIMNKISLRFGRLIEQNKTGIFHYAHFKDQVSNLLIEEIIGRLVYNDC